MTHTPPPTHDAGSNLVSILTAPMRLLGRATVTVVWFPLSHIGKKIPLA